MASPRRSASAHTCLKELGTGALTPELLREMHRLEIDETVFPDHDWSLKSVRTCQVRDELFHGLPRSDNSLTTNCTADPLEFL